MKHWAMNYDNCTSCHTTNKPHKAKGLCTTCYYRQYQEDNPRVPPKRYKKVYDEGVAAGYELGRTVGLNQAAHSINRMFAAEGVHCVINNDIMYISRRDEKLSGPIKPLRE